MKFIKPFAYSLWAALLVSGGAQGQRPASPRTENLVIITLDGMRWQEVFGGLDSALWADRHFTRDSDDLSRRFGSAERAERRKKLFPFLWSKIQSEGQLFGDRILGSEVDNANPYKFSYPGYNEIFTGDPDPAINSNDFGPNPHTNVLEFINQQKGFQGKIAVFSTWNAFPRILNQKRSGLLINSDVDTLRFKEADLRVINDMQFLTTRPIGSRPDILTYFAGRQYLIHYHPRVLYIAFDETDDFAHAGLYNDYLNSAHAEDGMIADLWAKLQSIPQYRNKTTLVVTSDHGRGDQNKAQWKDHGQRVADAGHIWIAVLGPDTKAKGLVKTSQPLYQKQLAPTLAAFLGLKFTPDQGPVEPISSVLSMPAP